MQGASQDSGARLRGPPGCSERARALSSRRAWPPGLRPRGRRERPIGQGARRLFSAVLREQGTQRMVYSSPVAVRIVLVATILVIVLGVASVPEGPFLSRFNAFSLALIAICLFGVLYLDRWVFDKRSNLFERDVGILFLYGRQKAPLDALQKVVLHQAGAGADDSPNPGGLPARRIAVLSVVDRDSRIFKLDTARGGSVRGLRRSAERLSSFCEIPLESGAAGLATEADE